MSGPIPACDYVEHFDPDLPHHRAWLLAVLEQLVAHEPQALEEGGTLRGIWTARQQTASAGPQPSATAPPGSKPSRGNPLSVPWFAQLDSATDQARRMCFSSSCAMLLAFLRPGVLAGSNGDDQYLARVRQFGDTTDAAAQIKLTDGHISVETVMRSPLAPWGEAAVAVRSARTRAVSAVA